MLAKRPSLSGFVSACVVVIVLSVLGNLVYVNKEIQGNNARQAVLAEQAASLLAAKAAKDFESSVRLCFAWTYVIGAAAGAKFFTNDRDSYGHRLEYGFTQADKALNCKQVLNIGHY
jgi:hypothetical protein